MKCNIPAVGENVGILVEIVEGDLVGNLDATSVTELNKSGSKYEISYFESEAKILFKLTFCRYHCRFYI